MDQENSDVWKDWLLQHRHGNDPQLKKQFLGDVAQLADRVLDGARLSEGMALADIGTGDGLVAFRAIERLGPSLNVVMTDISAPLLDYVRTAATARGVQGQCAFLQCSADAMPGMADNSVDALTTRAVVTYVADKPAAFREFHRVVRPGGYLSMAEPILRDDALEVCALRKLVESGQGVNADPFFPLLLRWRSALYPDTEEKLRQFAPTNFGERDLVRYAIDAGFTDIHLEFHVDVRNEEHRAPWEAFINASPHPLAPTLSKVLDEQFTPQERSFFEMRLRELYEQSSRFSIDRIAWMTARKPAKP